MPLKQMLDRKRHNDAARVREFDELRRKRNAESIKRSADIDKTSMLPLSTDLAELEERASTLKKIDEIESQMSEQWWHGGAAAPKRARAAAPQREPLAPPPEADADAPAASPLDTVPLDEVMTTQMHHEAFADTVPMGPGMAAPAQSQRAVPGQDSRMFAHSTLRAADAGANPIDPVLEEAAIRFANQDDAGAEAVLLAAVQDPKARLAALASRAEALFDLYRCTGQRQAFERLVTLLTLRLDGAPAAWDPSAKPKDDDFASTQVLEPESAAAPQQAALSGHLQGDCEALLTSFQIPSGACLMLSCRDLVRVDLIAAGCLLNWAARVESAGGCIVLRDVSPLLVPFFNLVGINDYAQVKPRSD